MYIVLIKIKVYISFHNWRVFPPPLNDCLTLLIMEGLLSDGGVGCAVCVVGSGCRGTTGVIVELYAYNKSFEAVVGVYVLKGTF